MSTLIKTARALDDQRFLWRVRAAMLEAASYHVRAGATEDTSSGMYARHILANPMAQDRRMEALVATDDKVAAAVMVDEYSTVNTEYVTDEDINTAVAANWQIAAELTFPPTPQG